MQIDYEKLNGNNQEYRNKVFLFWIDEAEKKYNESKNENVKKELLRTIERYKKQIK